MNVRSFLPILLLTALNTRAQELPALSPKSTVTQRVGLTDISIEYSRPSMKGRTIFGSLVPYGEVWRTGANNATVIRFSTPVLVENETVPAGKYALFTIPGEGKWQVILNTDTNAGTADRKAENDILNVTVASTGCELTETFTIEFNDVKDDKAVIALRWEKSSVPVRVEADATKRAMANIEAALAKPDADFRAYARSAQFSLDRKLDVVKALEWAKKSVSMQARYWNTFTLASAYHANGDKANAIATAREAYKLAEVEKDNSSMRSYAAKIKEWETTP